MLGLAVLMSLLAFLTGTITPNMTRSVIAVVIFFCGALIVLVAGYQFRKAATTVNPLTPEQSSKLVTSGIYRFSRNPMYIGFLLFLLAWLLFLGNVYNLFFLPLFVVLINQRQIKPEEKILQQKFVDEYQNYASRVRRWL